MRIPFLVILAGIFLAPASLPAQAPAESRDSLVDHLAGTWKVQGQVVGREAHHQVRAEWVLHHQFLRIEEKTSADAPRTESPYEALWFLGYDEVSERYVLHLIDVFGARYSETLGYGTRDGNQIRFVFEYPDGPFHTTFRWNPDKDSWEWLLEQKDKNGKWASFADLSFTRVANP
jgi:uncharacterized protein DUF1579